MRDPLRTSLAGLVCIALLAGCGTEFCSALHLEMAGYFLVEPSARSQR
ncbi:MAG: hypothetical protein IID28_02390 [Planctomycetes bacterium]|nr:hypothetical protein [Planctomycetota bacterium]